MGVRRIDIVKHGDLHAGHARSGKNAQQRQETLGKARRRVWVINKQYGERTREMLELAKKICCPNKDCRTSEPTPGNGHVGSHVTHHRDAPSLEARSVASSQARSSRHHGEAISTSRHPLPPDALHHPRSLNIPRPPHRHTQTPINHLPARHLPNHDLQWRTGQFRDPLNKALQHASH